MMKMLKTSKTEETPAQGYGVIEKGPSDLIGVE